MRMVPERHRRSTTTSWKRRRPGAVRVVRKPLVGWLGAVGWLGGSLVVSMVGGLVGGESGEGTVGWSGVVGWLVS